MKTASRSRYWSIRGFALVACVAAQAWAQDTPTSVPFSIVSASAIQELPNKKDSPLAQEIIQAALTQLTEAPHPLAKYHTEGTLPHQGNHDESARAELDFGVMLNLAMAYRLTGDERFLHQVNNYIDGWLSIYHVSLNPIDETGIASMLVAFDLVKTALPEETTRKIKIFLRSLAEGYADQVVKKEKDAGNWQSHRIKLLTLSAFALGDKDLIQKSHEAFAHHIKVNINPDGSVCDFYLRDALHYVVYDLEPLSLATLAAKTHGENWYNEGAPASVADAINWIIPFAKGQQIHLEFVHSKVKFDQTRANAGVGEYAPHPWDPSASITLLSLAAANDSEQRELYLQIISGMKQTPTAWMTLLFGR